MYTQTQKALSILLLTSMLLQSCGTNLMLEEQRSQMREKRQETQPAALESFPAATKPEYREGLHAASSQAPPPYTAYAAWRAQQQRQGLPCPLDRRTRLRGGAGSENGGAPEEKQSGPPSSSSASPRARRPSFVALQARMAQADIESSEQLVDKLNAAQDPQEQLALQSWLQGYIDWFSREPIGSLLLRPDMIEEYSLLAGITPTTPAQRRLVLSHFDSLCRKVKEADYHQATPLIQALEYTLQHMDATVFRGDPTPLIRLSSDLLRVLSAEDTLLIKATYPTFRPMLYTLHKALVLARAIAPDLLPTSQPGGLYRRFREKLINLSSGYYLMHYQQQLLLQSLQRLEQRNESRTALRLRRLGHGLKGVAHLAQGVRALATLDFDLGSFKESHDSLRKAFANKSVTPEQWYEWHQALNHACVQALEEGGRQDAFMQGLNRLKNQVDSVRGDKSAYKALRLGMILQLGLLALKAEAYRVRQEAMDRLLELANEWHDDADIVEAMLDQLAELAVQNTHRKDAEDTLSELIERADEATAGTSRRTRRRQESLLPVAVNRWLGEQNLDDKLEALHSHSHVDTEPGRLFSVVNDYLSPPAATAPSEGVPSAEVLARRIAELLPASTSAPFPAAQELGRQIAAVLQETAPALAPEALAQRIAQLLPTADAPTATTPTAEELARQVATLLPSAPSARTPGAAPSEEEIEAAKAALRTTYQQPHFALVPSFLGDVPLAVSEVQCQLMLLEQVEVQDKQEEREKQDKQEEQERARGRTEDHVQARQKRLELRRTPMPLAELFKPRSKGEGQSEEQVQRVLLTGEAGMGKTTLTKQLAHAWAQGTWGGEFEALYVLPVRALQQRQYDNLNMRRTETLATAIVNQCFTPQGDQDFERLSALVSQTLAQPHTLVVLDGLDERYGASEKLLTEALGGQHKLLLLSRPYGIAHEQQLVDVKVEHAGLSTEQMEQYLTAQLEATASEALMTFLKTQPAMLQLSHVPVNLQILCALWRDDAAGVQAVTRRGSLSGLYRKLTEYTWQRYREKEGIVDQGAEERERLFEMLGEIALRGLVRGEILISPETVREVAEEYTRSETLPRESGLLLQAAGRKSQFMHLTLQEYFAGRKLAQDLCSARRPVRARAVKFLSKHKYQPQYGVTLSFMAEEVSREAGRDGLEQLLEALQEGPEEVTGLQHFFLELRCVEAWLRVQEEEGLAALEEAYHLEQRLVRWFEKGLACVRTDFCDDVLIKQLTGMLSEVRGVVRESPALLTPLLTAVRDSSGHVRNAARAALGELAKAAPSEAVRTALIAAVRDSDRDVRSAASAALGELVSAAPHLMNEAVRTALLAAARDSNDLSGSVCSAACAALGELAKAAPHLMNEAVREALLAAARDSHEWVRRAACKALGELAKAAPSEAVREALIAAARNSNLFVRRAASAALGELVKADPSEAVREALIAAARDSNEGVRSAASAALGELAKADPSEAIREALIAAVGDSNAWVRSAACEALSELAKADPSEAVREALIAAAGDSDRDVRRAASAALGKLVSAAPHLMNEAVRTALIHAARDSNLFVRSAASAALGEVAKAAPHLMNEAVLTALLTAARNSNLFVRSAASAALGELVKADPQHAEAVREALIAAARGSNSNVRSAASAALGELVKADPQHAEAVREALIAAARGSNSNVRRAASGALGALANAAPHLMNEAVLRALLTAARDSNE